MEIIDKLKIIVVINILFFVVAGLINIAFSIGDMCFPFEVYFIGSLLLTILSVFVIWIIVPFIEWFMYL